MCQAPLATWFSVRDAMHMLSRGVRLSVTFVYSVETTKHILSNFSPSGSHTILVFPYQTLWQYSDGDPLTGVNSGAFIRSLGGNIWGQCLQGVSPVVEIRSQAPENAISVVITGEHRDFRLASITARPSRVINISTVEYTL